MTTAAAARPAVPRREADIAVGASRRALVVWRDLVAGCASPEPRGIALAVVASLLLTEGPSRVGASTLVNTIGTGSPRSAFSFRSARITLTAAASQGRSAGSLAINLTTKLSSASGMSGFLALGRGGGSVRWLCIRTTADLPVNGGL